MGPCSSSDGSSVLHWRPTGTSWSRRTTPARRPCPFLRCSRRKLIPKACMVEDAHGAADGNDGGRPNTETHGPPIPSRGACQSFSSRKERNLPGHRIDRGRGGQDRLAFREELWAQCLRSITLRRSRCEERHTGE